MQDVGSGLQDAYLQITFGTVETVEDAQQAFGSAKFKASLASIGDGSRRSFGEYFSALKSFSSALRLKLADSPSFSQSSLETLEALKVLLVSVSLVTSRKINEAIASRDRLLPPAK